MRWSRGCRDRLKGGRYRRAETRRGLPKAGPLRVGWAPASKNRKLGGIPASTTSAETCPPTCALYGQGCYAEFAWTRVHWARVGREGLPWRKFLARVRALPKGTLWRHNEAGDLPGRGTALDPRRLVQLALANVGRRGFTFTHKPVGARLPQALFLTVRALGFVVNLSADSLAEADELAALDIAPVAVVVPRDAPIRLKTPAGRRVTICPAETVGTTCKDCELCAVPHRKAIVGFRAHGQMSARVSDLVQLRRATG